jgi:hypothetical protein
MYTPMKTSNAYRGFRQAMIQAINAGKSIIKTKLRRSKMSERKHKLMNSPFAVYLLLFIIKNR